MIARKDGKKRGVARWKAKLEKLAAHRNEGGNIIDIKHDLKLRRWTFSIIHKLHGTALDEDKLRLIEGHEGLKDCLLDEKHVAAACEECQRRTKERDFIAAPNRMASWNAKLEKLVDYVIKGGDPSNIQNDAKLREWTHSLILSLNSPAIKGEKLKLIESHEGLKECLLEEEHVAAAKQGHKRKQDEITRMAAKLCVNSVVKEDKVRLIESLLEEARVSKEEGVTPLTAAAAAAARNSTISYTGLRRLSAILREEEDSPQLRRSHTSPNSDGNSIESSGFCSYGRPRISTVTVGGAGAEMPDHCRATTGGLGDGCCWRGDGDSWRPRMSLWTIPSGRMLGEDDNWEQEVGERNEDRADVGIADFGILEVMEGENGNWEQEVGEKNKDRAGVGTPEVIVCEGGNREQEVGERNEDGADFGIPEVLVDEDGNWEQEVGERNKDGANFVIPEAIVGKDGNREQEVGERNEDGADVGIPEVMVGEDGNWEQEVGGSKEDGADVGTPEVIVDVAAARETRFAAAGRNNNSDDSPIKCTRDSTSLDSKPPYPYAEVSPTSVSGTPTAAADDKNVIALSF